MKEMSAMQGGAMSFYGEMPDSYNLIVNEAHPLVARVISDGALTLVINRWSHCEASSNR